MLRLRTRPLAAGSLLVASILFFFSPHPLPGGLASRAGEAWRGNEYSIRSTSPETAMIGGLAMTEVLAHQPGFSVIENLSVDRNSSTHTHRPGVCADHLIL
jgi:hypothetical protein